MDNANTKNVSKTKKRSLTKRVVIILVIVFIALVLVVQLAGGLFYSTGLDTTRMRLLAIRSGIKDFNEKVGRYPDSLNEMKEYGQKNPSTGLLEKWGKEFISDPDGVSEESTDLNGQGGWYCNTETREVKVNLTKPLNNYLPFYFGPHRNEIPSEW